MATAMDYVDPLLARDGSATLRGLKLALVGPSFQERFFRSDLEALGLTLHYAASEEKLSQVHRICAKAHGIIFIASFTSHATLTHVTQAAARHDIPMRRVHSRGLRCVREALFDLAPDMLAYRELRREIRCQENHRGSA
jgi:hypothetical protein